MPLYAFIYIYYISFLFYHLLLALAYYFIAYYIISCYLSFAKSKLYILYLSHTRAGFSGGWGFSGRFPDFWGVFGGSGGFYPSNGRFVDSWRALGAFCVRVRACCSVRAGVRACGGMPPPFFARAQSLGVYPLIVYGEYAGEYRVGAR